MDKAIIPQDFYVYLHRKATTNEVFYVGKGSGRRAWIFRARGAYWTNIVNKHGLIVEIVQSGLKEFEAFNLERDLIAIYGRKDLGLGLLVNGTDGGDGSSGAKKSYELIKKMSNAMLNPCHPIHSKTSREKSNQKNSKLRKTNPELWIKVPVMIEGKIIGLKQAGKILGTSDSNLRNFAKKKGLNIQQVCDWYASTTKDQRFAQRKPRSGFVYFGGHNWMKKDLCEKYNVSYWTVLDKSKSTCKDWLEVFKTIILPI